MSMGDVIERLMMQREEALEERDAALEAIRARQRACVQTAKERDAALERVEELEGTCARALSNLREYFDDDERSSGWLDNAEGELETVSTESKEGGA